ncbi:Uma2 family endonuclease [Leptolyngbya boryana CZ1]|uniref:Uma2 family endonuclease n=1 Tax=Leptolyngbya boryana CZ1 TaxID=3060204 RepID=A0AA96X136_LEPBY|nr:Uma2 family endonuclease [Leptolyngbya boryana]WNZ47914.1 Uma2 family endonuclease [Leptolyngbya boryana CZ1]
MTVTTYRWTLDRYHQAVEAGIFDDQPVELLNGELITMSPEGLPHAHLTTDGAEYLREVLGRRALIREGHPITIPRSASEPEPDIAIVERLGDVYLTHHPYPENIFWVIEYSNSSLNKDTESKRKIYAAAEIREYWVVNLKQMELIVYRDPVEGDYRSEQKLIAGKIRPLAFLDVEIEVDRLIRRSV